MSNQATFPPLIGKQTKRFLATVFGSTDGTFDGIADKFDRARCEARAAFEERYMKLVYAELCRNNGSPDGTLAGIKSPATREKVAMAAHHARADNEAAFRKMLMAPAAIPVDAHDFSDPFGDATESPLQHVAPMDCADAGDVPEMVAELNEHRLAFAALLFGAENGQLEQVDDDKREALHDYVVEHHQDVEQRLADACKVFGSRKGTVEGIPAAKRASAARFWHRQQELFANRCEFELDLLRIELEEKAHLQAEQMDFA
jgi:hypothetical protein